nr:uncharacterized protein LOC112769769 [Arachis hypogaea]
MREIYESVKDGRDMTVLVSGGGRAASEDQIFTFLYYITARPPILAAEFNFDSNCSSSYITAPSNSQCFSNFFFSAPTSPTRISTFINNNIPLSSSLIHNHHQHEQEFQFNFNSHLEPPSLSANELFDDGKILTSSTIVTATNSSSSSSRNNTKPSHALFLSSISFTRGYPKWRLKDFLLFRSAAEGRVIDKDHLRKKYEVLSKDKCGGNEGM